jgi:Protein of unknown function (DUF1569)
MIDKINFLKNDFPKLLQTLEADAKGSWGVLNGQQMVEHMTYSVRFATGPQGTKLMTPADKVEVAKSFAMSDKEFKPNTKNTMMSEIPEPAVHPTMQDSIHEFQNEVATFVTYFENNKGATLTNPFFGDLNFEEWTQLLSKHAKHHCKQFGLM